METLCLENRYVRVMQGGVRFQLYDLEGNEKIKEKFTKVFSSLPGVIQVEASLVSGRVFIQYVESLITLKQITTIVQSFEQAWFKKKHQVEEAPLEQEREPEQKMVAATYDETIGRNERFRFLPMDGKRSRTLPLAAMIATGGALFFTIKRWIYGPSILAAHPIPFYLSAATAILTGYPFFKRSIDLANRKRPEWKIDWLLGASSLALGLVRENVVVLAGLAILNTLNWKRQRANIQEDSYLEESGVLPEIKRYNNRMGKIGFAAAGMNMAVTRNPLTTLALLLAANPRPSRIASEFSWKQAQLHAKEEGWTMPENGSAFQLSQLTTVIAEDPAVFVENDTIRQEAHHLFHALPKDTVVIVGNKMNNTKSQEESEAARYTIASMYPNLHIVDSNTSYPADRNHALVINASDRIPMHTLDSYYPSIEQHQMEDLAVSLQKVAKIRKTNLRQLQATKLWNLAGSVLAVTGRYAAPVINLMADTLIFLFLSHNQKDTKMEQEESSKQEPQLASALEEGAPVFTWHAKQAHDLMDQFHSDQERGLSSLQVKKKRMKYGKNEWTMKENPHWLVTYFGQLKEFTTVILAGTAAISMVQGHLFDGLVMGSILLANAAVGAYQERKAANLLESVNDFKPPVSRVIRNGKEVELPATDLVPGDIVNIEAGDRVPADLRLLRSWNMEVNEAALTGESLPVPKNVDILDNETTVADRSNMLFMGTDLTRGKGRAIVVGTGNETEMGHLLKLLTEEKEEKTMLQEQVDSVSKKFVKLAMFTGSLVFLTGVIRGYTLSQMLSTSIALAASAIPEGLPVTITIALSAGVLRLSKKKAITRRLSALESMGRVTVICSDKTGTLTKNQMTVTKAATPHDTYEVTGNGYTPEGTIAGVKQASLKSKDVEDLMKVGWLCQNTSLYEEEGEWKVKGDPTEAAILTLGRKYGFTDEHFAQWHRVHEIPFDSQRGMMSVVCKEHEDHKDCYVMTKGSLEKVLERCTHYQENGVKKRLSEKVKQQFMEQNHQFAEQALRVIAFAYAPITSDPASDTVEEVERDLTYVGMVGMIDPPKSDVKDSILECERLGIKPVMITGDHPKTAQAIGEQIGLKSTPESILTGAEIDQMDEGQLLQEVNHVSIFARVTPDHKLRIVKALQSNDQVVAMSGDGVNDSPAIKQADVGIAMGQEGTEVTKEAADIVLTEDHFQIILDAVKQGRSIIGNIRRALGCLLSGNIAEIMVTSVAVIVGMPLPVIPIQILLMNLLTDALPAMVFAINPGQSDNEGTRKKIADGPLYKQVITRGVLLGTSTLALFGFMLASGAPLMQAQTIAFSTLVMGQLIQTFSWRKHETNESFIDFKRDRFLIGAISISALSLLSVIYVPALATMFKTATLMPTQWLLVLAAAGSSALIARPITAMIQRKEASEKEQQLQQPLALVG